MILQIYCDISTGYEWYTVYDWLSLAVCVHLQALNVRLTKHQLLVKSVLWPGVCVTMPFISTASLAGSRLGRCVPLTTESGSSTSE